MNNPIYIKTDEYIDNIFERYFKENLFFHNINHTKEVVRRTKEIVAHYNLSDIDSLVLYVASSFHDVGYLFVDASEHEKKSVELMKDFAKQNQLDDNIISKIESCILATKQQSSPQNILEQIICDADTYHLGTKDFKHTNKLVYKEYKAVDKEVSKEEWNVKTVKLLKEHVFYTKYCFELLEETKRINLKSIEEKMEKENSTNKKIKIKDADSLTAKGIQTMLRLTSENHLKLSDMADHKANILISVNSIIISIILGVLLRKLQDEPYLTIPSIIFLLIAVTTIVIAILATRPKLSSGTFTKQDVLDKKTNLLFFGNFHKASYEEYDLAMRHMMRDSDYLYESLIKDIYQLAVVLGRKYRLIHLAYNIFMIGLIVAVISFMIAEVFFGSTQMAATTFSNGSPL